MISPRMQYLQEGFLSGFLLTVTSGADAVAERLPRFLLEPGGQDYVGDNSYDEKLPGR